MKTLIKRKLSQRILSPLVGLITFTSALGLTGFSSSAEGAGWIKINRYWMGYWFDNGDWQFFYNDGRVRGMGNYRRSSGWSHFYGHSSTKSYVRQPRQWGYRYTIYGTPGARIYPSL